MNRDTTRENSVGQEGESGQIIALKEQHEVALACFILSAALSAAVLWANLGAEPQALNEARDAVEVHRKLFQQHQVLLAANQKALADVEVARDALVRARADR